MKLFFATITISQCILVAAWLSGLANMHWAIAFIPTWIFMVFFIFVWILASCLNLDDYNHVHEKRLQRAIRKMRLEERENNKQHEQKTI